MSISNIYIKARKYWGAYVAGLIFFILGILTIYGVLLWYLSTTPTTYKIGIVCLGFIIGLLELIESYRLCRIPFKHK